MRLVRKFVISAVAATCLLTSNTMAMNNLLDGMFVNVTAPDVVSSQLRGTISGGGVYLRTPVTNIQLMSLDMPRFSAGCGGIDIYLGSFSFITAEKLTQFIRKLAQQAGPLLFKLALGQMNAALSGELDKFQHMAQMMNDMQANSCQLAQGLVDAASNPANAKKSLENSITSAIGTTMGWSGDFTAAKTAATETPTLITKKACSIKDSQGNMKSVNCGNITWEAIRSLKNKNIAFGITDNDQQAKEILLSLLGGSLIKLGKTDDAEVIPVPLKPTITLEDLFNPTTYYSGTRGVKTYICLNDDCTIYSDDNFFGTHGINGYVRKQMFGNETASSPQPGSIVYKMGTCIDKKCAITDQQKRFLNAMSKVPAVTLLTRAQFNPDAMNNVAEYLIPMMVDEISILYGHSVIDVANSVFTNNDFPGNDNNFELIQAMRNAVRTVKERTVADISKTNDLIKWLESAFASNSKYLANIFGK